MFCTGHQRVPLGLLVPSGKHRCICFTRRCHVLSVASLPVQGQVRKAPLTTKQRSQISSSFSTAVSTPGSRASPNHTTWGRRSPLQPSSSHLCTHHRGTASRFGLHYGKAALLLAWACLTCNHSSPFSFTALPTPSSTTCWTESSYTCVHSMLHVCWKYTCAAWSCGKGC